VKLKLIALSILATASIATYAAESNTQNTRFEFQSEEVVFDRASGKSWMRCPVGYTVNNQGTENVFADDTCDVVSKSTYSFQASKNIEGQGTYSDWKLPSKTDVVAMFGLSPDTTIQDKNIFPETQAGKFWFEAQKDNNGDQWVADPMNKTAHIQTGSEKYEVRLVSDSAIDQKDS
jgi:hypothetical protein